MIRNIILSTLTIFIFLNSANSSEIKEFLKKAYDSSNQIKSEQQAMKSAEIGYKKSIANLLPKASASLSRTKLDRKDKTAHIRSKDSYDSDSITVVQNLFNGGADFANINISKLNKQISNLRFKSVEQSVLLEAANAYIEYMIAEEAHKVAKINREQISKQLESTNLRFELGEVTKTDVAQAKARLSSAEAQVIKYKGELDSKISNFVKIFGEVPVDLSKPTLPNSLPANFDEALRIARANNLNLLVSEINYRASKEGIKLSWAKILPNVNLQASISKTQESAFTNNRDDKTLLMTVNIPIFQNGSEYLDIKNSSLIKEKAKYEYYKTLEDLSNTVNSAWINYQTSKSSISSALDAVESATLAYDGVNEEAKIGLKTTLDLLNAEQELFQARLQLLNVEYQTILAAYQLLAVIGNFNLNNI